MFYFGFENFELYAIHGEIDFVTAFLHLFQYTGTVFDVNKKFWLLESFSQVQVSKQTELTIN